MKTERAINAYLKGDIGLSTAAFEANLSVWDFITELNQSKTNLNFDLEQFFKEVNMATEFLAQILKTKEK